MKINVINEHKSSVKVIILPFIQDENFENLLQKIAQDFTIDFELLKQDFKAEAKEIHINNSLFFKNWKAIFLISFI